MNENIAPLRELRANRMGNGVTTQILMGRDVSDPPVVAITSQLPNELADKIIFRCNTYPALTARVKELESDRDALQAEFNRLVQVGNKNNGEYRALFERHEALQARVKELEEALRNLADDYEFGQLGTVRKEHLAKARAALNKEPTSESRCICNDAPPIHKIPGESFDDEAMRHYENLDHYREHCPLHGRFVNKETT